MRQNIHPLVRWAVDEMAHANGIDPELLWGWIERRQRMPHETAASIVALTGGRVTVDDFEVERPPLFVAGAAGRPANAVTAVPPYRPGPGHRGPLSGGANDEFCTWADEKFGSMSATAIHYKIKRSTLSAWASGRNSCPGLWRERFFRDSEGKVSLASWDRAAEAFRRNQRAA